MELSKLPFPLEEILSVTAFSSYTGVKTQGKPASSISVNSANASSPLVTESRPGNADH